MPNFKLEPISKKLSILSLALSFTLSLTIVGCVTTESASTDKTKQILEKTQNQIPKKSALATATSQREELIESVLKSFDVPSFIDIWSQSNSTITRECAMSQNSIDNSHKYFYSKLHNNIIHELSDEEVLKYLEFMNEGGLDFNLKFNHFVYSLMEKESNGIKYSLNEETNKLINNLSKNEKRAIFTLKELPNKFVNNLLFPVGNEKFKGTDHSLEIYRMTTLTSLMTLPVIMNCQVPNKQSTN